MQSKSHAHLLLSICLLAGLAILGYQLSNSHILLKRDERSVTVKGLSEREVEANIVIWPISFSQSSNSIDALHQSLEENKQSVITFLKSKGLKQDEISSSLVKINDQFSNGYVSQDVKYRYSATQNVVTYTDRVALARQAMDALPELGKHGVATTQNYDAFTEYLYTQLNQIKPEMIEEATKNARQSAEKFAADSQSTIGKIKYARQGQFSISNRDTNTPHIKKIRIVSTIEYYLVD